jgi:hypothetical protein
LEGERITENMGLDSQQTIYQLKKSGYVEMVEDVTVEDKSLKLPV